jgi:hypothetical protein
VQVTQIRREVTKHYFAVTIDSTDKWDDLKLGHLIEQGKRFRDDLTVSELDAKDIEGAHWPLVSSYHVGPLFPNRK